MAAKKTTKKTAARKTAAKKPAKAATAKPKKAARSATPKVPKAPKAPKATKGPRKPRSATPTSGQSGPPLDLLKAKLNSKEERVVSVLLGDVNPIPINALATNCFSDQAVVTADSWVRNSLRRLVRAKWVEKVGRGTYVLTDTGRERAQGVFEAKPEPTTPSEPAPEPSSASEPEAAQPSA